MNVKENWTRFFLNSAGGILLAAALERFLVAFGHAQVLSLPDPALGFTLRYSVLITGVVELSVALICLLGKQGWLRLMWIAWLSGIVVVLRVALPWVNCHSQATCIGSLTDPLHISRGVIGFIIELLPLYLLIGSYGTLGWLWAEGKITAAADDFSKMPCPACGTHIKFSLRSLGQIIPCPHCHAVIKLRKPEEKLKMSCYFCNGHIEFPYHALGQKITCPHCENGITLKQSATA